MFAHRQNISHAINPSAIPTKTGCFQWESPIETWSVFTPLWVPSGKPLDLPCQNPRKPSNFKCQRHLIKIPSNIKLYGGGNFDSIPCYVYVCIYIYHISCWYPLDHVEIMIMYAVLIHTRKELWANQNILTMPKSYHPLLLVESLFLHT